MAAILYDVLHRHNNMKILTCVCLLILLNVGAYSQDIEMTPEERYAHYIKQEYINDIYIPIDVPDAMIQMDLLSDELARNKILEIEEEEAADRLSMGLGRWMIIKWNFYEGSRLSHALKQIGVSYPEDMAHFLIVSYHRHLRGADLELKSRGQTYLEKRNKEREAAKKTKGSN